MPKERGPKRRSGGACAACVRKKRKCDHKQPQCSQCLKHGDSCDLRIFKRWPEPARTDSVTEGRESRRLEPPDERDLCSPRHATSDTLLPLCSPPSFPIFIQEDGEHPLATSAEHDPDSTASAITPYLTSIPATEAFYVSDVDQSLLHFNYECDGVDAFNEQRLCYPQNTMIAAVGSDTVPAPSAPVPNTQSLELHLNQNNPVCWNNDLSTERQFLWQYFIFAVKPEFMAIQMGEVTSPLGEFQDPYSTFLPCLALENPALRNALLCSSAVSFQHTHGRRDFDGIIRAVAREALQSLQMQALDPQGLSDWNLLATILAATYLHVQCFAWEKSDGYLHLATYFAQTLFRRSRRQHAVAKECLEMTLVTYRWSMISTLCSLREPQRALIPKDVCRVIELDGNEISQNFSTAFQDWVSHPLYVFSPHLVNPLLRIGKLLEQQLLLQAQDASDPTVDGVDLGQSFQDEIADVEKMLVEAREANMDQVESSTGRGEPKMFLSVNEATYATSMVLLNARLKGMPYTAPLIREHVQLIVNEISGPALDSQLSRSCAFYLFIAGCEAVDTQVREAIESRLKVLTWSVFSNLADLCASLHHVWKIRDQEPGLAWPYWAQKTASKYRVECLY